MSCPRGAWSSPLVVLAVGSRLTYVFDVCLLLIERKWTARSEVTECSR